MACTRRAYWDFLWLLLLFGLSTAVSSYDLYEGRDKQKLNTYSQLGNSDRWIYWQHSWARTQHQTKWRKWNGREPVHTHAHDVKPNAICSVLPRVWMCLLTVPYFFPAYAVRVCGERKKTQHIILWYIYIYTTEYRLSKMNLLNISALWVFFSRQKSNWSSAMDMHYCKMKTNYLQWKCDRQSF